MFHKERVLTLMDFRALELLETTILHWLKNHDSPSYKLSGATFKRELGAAIVDIDGLFHVSRPEKKMLTIKYVCSVSGLEERPKGQFRFEILGRTGLAAWLDDSAGRVLEMGTVEFRRLEPFGFKVDVYNYVDTTELGSFL